MDVLLETGKSEDGNLGYIPAPTGMHLKGIGIASRVLNCGFVDPGLDKFILQGICKSSWIDGARQRAAGTFATNCCNNFAGILCKARFTALTI